MKRSGPFAVSMAITVYVMMGIAAYLGPSRAEPRAHVSIGDLDLAYDTEKWRVVANDQHIIATCTRADCRGADVIGNTNTGTNSDCETLIKPAARRSKSTTISLRGIVLLVAEVDLGCRNLVPARVSACVSHIGRVYRFDSGPHTCRSGASIATTGAVIDLLKGLSAR